MAAKVRIQKRLYYKIGDACKALGIQPYVLRYWETEFPALSPAKSRSGQRVYSEKELEIIRRIKGLLYDEGYTIAGAKKKLEAELESGAFPEEGGEPVAAAAPAAASAATAPAVKNTSAPRAQSAPAAPLPALAVLDTGTAERVQTLVSGIEEALVEAKEILALLRG
jgi:DNA-binding transcriptional MerR regulator